MSLVKSVQSTEYSLCQLIHLKSDPLLPIEKDHKGLLSVVLQLRNNIILHDLFL